jgi:subtilisin family serine protease
MRMLWVVSLLVSITAPVPNPASATPPPSEGLVAIVENRGSLRFVELDGTDPLPDGHILGLSKNPKVGLFATSPFAPSDDPRSNEQWGLRAVGAATAWPISRGAGVTVAVLDTGVAPHEDLPPLLPGKSFTGAGSDPNGHGTHVAGIIAAIANNQKGVAGLAPGVSILPVQVLDADGFGDHANIANGIIWATDNGADVINLSLGGEESSDALRAAVEYAHSRGVVLVAAAGNSGSGSNAPMYPAAYPEVIAVAASAPDGSGAMFSNSGFYVDISAPGFAILSTIPSGYTYYSGTSQASPFVAAAAALLLSTGAPASDVQQRLVSSARDIAPNGRDDATGAGFLDAARSLGAPATTPSPAPNLPPLPDLPAVPELPTLRPPGSTPGSSAPVVSLMVPDRVEYGSSYDASVMVLGCSGCVLSLRAPGERLRSIMVPEGPSVVSVRLTATLAGLVTVSDKSDTVLAKAPLKILSKISVAKPLRRRVTSLVSGTIQPSPARVFIDKLDRGTWRQVAIVPVSKGSFKAEIRRTRLGLYRVRDSSGSVSKTFSL